MPKPYAYGLFALYLLLMSGNSNSRVANFFLLSIAIIATIKVANCAFLPSELSG